MNIELIHDDYPIWKITNWKVPHIDYTETHAFDQSSKRYKSSELRHTVDAHIDMYGQGYIIQDMLRKNNSILLDQMWKGHMERFHWPIGGGDLLVDKPGFSMPAHVDNRFVLGVLIINLQDNPMRSGTWFTDLEWGSPVKKGTGVFFLNNENTKHTINQPGPEDRFIMYQTLTLDNLHYD
tara:strand:+ start:198 stop:737 length:540 start_codon:yes stop_codon:yes gene_type:complete